MTIATMRVEGAQKRNSFFLVDSQGVCVFAWRR